MLLRRGGQRLGDCIDAHQLLLEPIAHLLQLTLLHEKDGRDLEQLLRHRLEDGILREATGVGRAAASERAA